MKLKKISIGIVFALTLNCFALTPMKASASDNAASAVISQAEGDISLNKTEVSLEKGKKVKLQALTSEDLTSQNITWKTSNKKVATVNKQGVVTAKKKGNAVITAKIKGTDTSAKCEVDVKKYVTMKVKTTGYCNCSKCCGSWAGGKTASGTKPKQGRTIAVDRSLIRLGSKVEIGNKTYVAEDTGGAIKGKKIDIYYGSHKKALAHGVKYQAIKVYM